jgi:hypothetical protein
VALLSALVVVAAWPAQAPAASGKTAPEVRILNPAQGAFVAGQNLRVVVRSAGKRFRAWLGPKEITDSFERRGDRRVAELRRPPLRPGVEHLYVEAGKGSYDFARFVVSQRQTPHMLDAGPSTSNGKLSPMAVLASRPHGTSLHAYLNGRRLRGEEFEHLQGETFRGALGADEGARFGDNVLRLVAFSENGTFDVETFHFRLSERRPLAAAGPRRRTTVNQAVRLDARASRAAGDGRLEYRWRVLGSPSGVKGRAARSALRHAASARPVFRTPQAGTWKIGVTVRPAGGGPASHDVTSVETVPNDPPIGVPLRTIADANGKIEIAGEALGGTGAAGSTISYALISRMTRKPAKTCATSLGLTGSVAATTAGISTLEELVAACPLPKYLLILDGTQGVPAASIGELGKLFAKIGVAPLATADQNRLAAGGSFSVIGVPNSAPGSAFVNIARQTSTDPAKPLPAGALSGYLQMVSATHEYGFVFPDFVGYDTQSAHTDKSNTMTIGGVRYEATLGLGTAGFHVVILDPNTLEIRTMKELDEEELEEIDVPLNIIWPTKLNTPKENQDWIENLTEILQEHVIDKNGLVFMQSVNNPKPTDPGWDRIAQVIAKLGGSRTVFDQIDGTGGYALVAGPGLGLVESSVSLSHDPTDGHLAGVLSRSRNTGFGPSLAATLPGSSSEMMKILYQPAQPFPPFAKAGEKAADSYIAGKLFGDEAKAGGVRPQYWQNWGLSWENKNQQMRSEVPYPGKNVCGCEKAEFEEVTKRLGAEMTKLADVQKWLGKMESTLDASQSGFNLMGIAQKIEERVRPPDREVGSMGLKMMGGAIQLLGKAAGDETGAAGGAAAMFAFLGGLQTGGDGSPVLGEVRAKATDLSAQIYPRFELARSGFTKAGMIAASDWGKLQALAAKATGEWKLNDPTPIRTAINKATKRWFYTELMRAAWVLWELEVPNARNYDCLTGEAEASKTNYPFSEEPETGQYRAALGLQANLVPSTIVRALGVRNTFQYLKSIDDSSAQPPSAGITDPLFAPADLDPASNGLGMYPQQFYELNFERAWPPVSSGKFCDS